MIEPGQPEITVCKQCDLVGLARSSWYYTPHGDDAVDELLMRRIDEEYTRRPFYGSPRITQALIRQGIVVNHKRVERLMRRMGLAALAPGPHTSVPRPEHKKYPYLLQGLDIVRPNQVWATDITYIRMERGFVYLAAILDWFSRYVVAWELSNTLDVGFCLSALDKALAVATPKIFNTDQGAQYTSMEHTERLKQAGIAISMDGRGRFYDNIFVERLWRSVKYEEVYLHDYTGGAEAKAGLSSYFTFYNGERPHQALGWRTPAEVYHA